MYSCRIISFGCFLASHCWCGGTVCFRNTNPSSIFQEELHLFVLFVLCCVLFGRPKWRIPVNGCICSGCLYYLVSIYAVCCVLSAAVNQTSLVGQRRCELNTQCFSLSGVHKSILQCLSTASSHTA